MKGLKHSKYKTSDILTIDTEHSKGLKVDPWIFRTWTGPRYINDIPYTGPIYYLGTNKLYINY